MKKHFPLLYLLLLWTGVPLNAQQKRVLFLGNSYTASNNLPNTVAMIAQSLGDSLIYDSNTPGGYTLEGHSTNAASLSKIRSGGWDYVVLQEQSQKPSFPPAQVAAEVFPYAAQLHDTIKTYNPCAETVFFMTWGRKYGDQSNCQFYQPLCTFEGMQTRLRDSYMQMAQDNQSTVAPVGVAWQRSRMTDSLINLWSGDNSHPSAQGTYLAACVFYASFWQKPVSGATWYGSIGQQDAQFLQGIADLVVFDSLSQWRIGANLPQANFTWLASNDTVQFTSTASNDQSHFWDFGDGQSDTLANPQHIFPGNGTYVISYIVDSGCERDTLTDTLTISILTATKNALPQKSLEILPHPLSPGQSFQLRLPEFASDNSQVSVFDLFGKKVFEFYLNVG